MTLTFIRYYEKNIDIIKIKRYPRRLYINKTHEISFAVLGNSNPGPTYP